MSDLVTELQRDPVLCARLAAQNSAVPSLAELTARQVVRQQKNEEARRLRRLQQDEAYDGHLAAQHRRAMAPPKPPPLPANVLTTDDVSAIAQGIQKYVRERIAPLQDRLALHEDLMHAERSDRVMVDRHITKMEERIAELAARPSMKYAGIWSSEKAYVVNDFVTDKGSLFICKDTCIGVRPGTSNAWQLAVQRGRDGRDRR